MRTARSRLPKGFSLDERLAQCADAIESQPEKWAGSWRSWDAALLAASGDVPASTEVSPVSRSAESPQCSPRRFERVCLDLGCGKGGYTVACAEAHPDTLFVGIDVEGLCVLRAAECALEHGVSNAASTLKGFASCAPPNALLSTAFPTWPSFLTTTRFSTCRGSSLRES